MAHGMRPVINSQKRIVQTSLTSISAPNVVNLVLAEAKQDPTASAPQDVAVGSVIKAIYCEFWFTGASAQPPTMTVFLAKYPGGVAQIDATQIQDLNSWNNKNNILEMHQGIIGDSNANPVPMFRHWIKIPKGKQRFGISDRLILSIKAIITDDVEVCGISIFKVYN